MEKDKKAHSVKTYEVFIKIGEENTKIISIEGYSTSSAAISETDSGFFIYDADGKTPLLTVSWSSLIYCRTVSEEKILKVNKRKKIVSISDEEDDESE